MKANVVAATILWSLMLQVNTSSNLTSQKHKYESEASIRKSAGDLLIIHANDPRPLYQSTLALDRDLGWKVSYEDPPFTANLELTGSASPQWLANGGKDYLVPNGGDFLAELTYNPKLSAQTTRESALRQLVAIYNNSANPGRFSFVPVNSDRQAIVGVSSKDSRGFSLQANPVLDESISLVPRDKTIGDAINDVVTQVSQGAHTKLVLGAMPPTLTSINIPEMIRDRQPARSVLDTILDKCPLDLSYVLLWDSNISTYVLSFIPIGSHGTSSEARRPR